MSFVLMASTRGDSLERSRSFPVETSDDRGKLETLREDRAAIREDWLSKNPLPDYLFGSTITSEEIVEVPGV